MQLQAIAISLDIIMILHGLHGYSIFHVKASGGLSCGLSCDRLHQLINISLYINIHYALHNNSHVYVSIKRIQRS